MRVDRALHITRSWIDRRGDMTPAVRAALMLVATIGHQAAGPGGTASPCRVPSRRQVAAAIRIVTIAALRAIPSIDVIATRDEAKLGLRAVAALERHAVTLESASRGRRVA